jgi:heptosyltransferase-2
LLVGFHAGSATFKGHINKRWDYEKFAALAKLLKEKYNSAAILFGTENDLNNKIMALSQGTAFIPETKNLKQTIALMNKCKLFVSNDSALMHIAAALGIKQVAVFGYTNFNELHPWKNEHIIVRKELDCSPCFFNSPKPVNCIFEGTSKYKCIKTISVSEVYEACCNLLDKYKT